MRTKLILTIVIAVLLYLQGPLMAGVFGVGDREGPRIYPREYHTALYTISYEKMRNEKPRISMEAYELERPIFYGFPRTRRRS